MKKTFLLLPLSALLLAGLACQAVASGPTQPSGTTLQAPISPAPATQASIPESSSTSAEPAASQAPRASLPAPTKWPTEPLLSATPAPETAAPETAAPVTMQPAPTGVIALPGTLNATGPWLLVSADDGLWIANPDGSGLTRLTTETNLQPEKGLSPDGRRLAYVTADDPYSLEGLKLVIMDLPGGITQTVTSLWPKDMASPLEIGSPAFEAIRAIYDYSPPVWSPDGSRLAFMGAQDGPSSDLYVYTVASGSIDRLTDGPSQGYQPSWSPDGQWIVHTGVETFGTGAGYSMSGIWAARADGGGVRSLYPLKDTASEGIVGWIAPDTFVVYSWDMRCGGKNLRAVNLEGKTTAVLWPESFSEYNLAFDPQSGTAVVGATCGDSYPEGSYLVKAGSQPQQLSSEIGASWEPQAGLFFVHSGGQLQAFTPDGKPQAVAAWQGWAPIPASGNQQWAWLGDSQKGFPGIFIGPLAGPLKQITDRSTGRATWSPSGKTLLYFDWQRGFFVAHTPDFTPVQVSDQVQVKGSLYWAGMQP